MNTHSACLEPYAFKSFKYSSHDLILRMLAAEKTPQRILDLGVASGYLGMMLRKNGHYVAGIEKDAEQAAKAMKHYDAFYVADLESYDFPERQTFDYVLFADILEHLREPEAVLRKALRSLKPNGNIIISVPNMANILIRLGPLFGRFDYTDRGLLDKSHIRFYTLKSLKKMVAEISCEICDVVPTPLPFQIVFPVTQRKIFNAFHEIHYLGVLAWKTLLAYQFVLKAKPRSASQVPTSSAGIC